MKLGQAASVTAGVFYTDFKNKIDTVKINYVDESNYDAQDVNFGKVTAKGVELLFQTAAFYGVSFKGVIPTLMQKSKAVSTMVCAPTPCRGTRSIPVLTMTTAV